MSRDHEFGLEDEKTLGKMWKSLSLVQYEDCEVIITDYVPV